MKRVPFALLPPKVVEKLAKRLAGAGGLIGSMFPGMREQLIQASLDYEPREYSAIAFTTAVTNSVLVFLLVFSLGLAGAIDLLSYALLFALIVAPASFFTAITYPRILARRKIRLLGEYLIPACRQLIIELKSGVPLFNAMSSVSNDYGVVSEEFKKIVGRINSGVPDLDVLSDAARENPSFQFRKVLWQVSNALKVGSDVGSALEVIVNDLEKEKIDEIRKYGQELAPWTMIYMMSAVVLPSLGIALLIVITSFLAVELPSFTLGIVLAFLVIFQLFFMNFVASRRPLI